MKLNVVSPRARFMVETLGNVKNGKFRAAAGSEQGSEAAKRMKTFFASLGRRRRCTSKLA